MDDRTETKEARIGLEGYLSRLSKADQDNLRQLTAIFNETLAEQRLQGCLVAVGGTITKPLPRRDIDLLILLQKQPGDPDPKNFPTTYDYATADFQAFRKIIQSIAERDPKLEIAAVIEPAIDEEFGNPDILKHNGSIIVIHKTGQATPFEFVRIEPQDSYKTFLAKEKRPYVVLKEVSGT